MSRHPRGGFPVGPRACRSRRCSARTASPAPGSSRRAPPRRRRDKAARRSHRPPRNRGRAVRPDPVLRPPRRCRDATGSRLRPRRPASHRRSKR
ncbi:hypothetical protein CXP34_17760 [Ralstonia mannitolilytica]|nr:hypothetical protein CXP34_17760 [Ralstonia mannitolilytica]